MSQQPPPFTVRAILSAFMKGNYEAAERMIALAALSGSSEPLPESVIDSWRPGVIPPHGYMPLQTCAHGEAWLLGLVVERPEGIDVSMVVGFKYHLGPKLVAATVLPKVFTPVSAGRAVRVEVRLENVVDDDVDPGNVVLMGAYLP